MTDLDGTLLDQKTYSYEYSRPAIERLKLLKIPLILCSSKTRSEMLPLREELELAEPFIVENGGAICLPRGYFPFAVKGTRHRGPLEIVSLGTDVSVLRKALEEAASNCGAAIKSFGSMSLDDIGRLTGLGKDASQRAAEREYDEPFVIESGSREKLFAYLLDRGYRVVQGDRFAHILGAHDKGKAVRRLLDLYRKSGSPVFSLGLGNSANDLPMLCEVDLAVVVKNPDGKWDAAVLRDHPAARRTEKIGPEGWAEAVQQFLASRNL